MMILTDLGYFLKGLRLANREQTEDMAQKLGVTKSYIFAIQSGTRRMPDSWEGKLRDLYKLTPDQQKELRRLILESSNTLQIDISDASPPKRKLAISFVSQFEGMGEKAVGELQRVLDESEKAH